MEKDEKLPIEEPQATAEETAPADTRTAKEKFYDKLPVTYRQVDIFVKVLIGLTIAVIVLGVVFSGR